MNRAALYTRVSSREQLDGYSLDVQREAGIRYITERNWELVKIYSDEAETARTANRREFQLMLRELQDIQIDFLIVHRSDRFARNMLDHFATKEILKQHGVRLVSIIEDFGDNPEGRFAEGMMAAFNQFYSDRLSYVVKNSLAQKVSNGIWPTYAPVGYLNVKRATGKRRAEGVIDVDPDQGPLMREAFLLYSTGLYSISGLLDVMTAKGLRSKNGKCLSRSNLHHLLCHPICKGAVNWHGEEHPGEHEALVPVEVWDRVQEVLRQHANAEIRVRLDPHYLRGSLFCAGCGSRLSDHFAKGRAHRYFFCLGRHRRRTGCEEPYIPTHLIETAVEERWDGVRLSESRKRELREVVEAQVIDPDQQEIAMRRLEELAGERSKAAEMAVKGSMPEDLFRQEMRRIERETKAMNDILAGDMGIKEGPGVLERMFELVEKLPAAYARAKPNIERRGLNQAVFKRFWVAGREVRKHEYQPTYEELLEADLSDPARSNRNYVAGAVGFEPTIT